MKVHKLLEYYWNEWPERVAVSVCERELVAMSEEWEQVTCLQCLKRKPQGKGVRG
jgi:hypothetical protein